MSTLTAASSTYANLATTADADDTLTPVQFIDGTDTVALWHDIVYVARFVDASGQVVTVRHHFEDPNGTPATGDIYAWQPVITTTESAVNNTSHTATAYPLTGIYAGYDETTLTATDKTHVVNDAVSTTLFFDIYYLAHEYTLKYAYDNPGDTPSTVSASLPADHTYKFGQNAILAAQPTDTAGNWTFSGWSAKDSSGNPVVIGLNGMGLKYITMPASDTTVSGSWVRVSHPVTFAVYGTDSSKGTVTMPASGLSVNHGSNLKDQYGKNTVKDLGVSIVPAKDSSGRELYYVSGWTASWIDSAGNP